MKLAKQVLPRWPLKPKKRSKEEEQTRFLILGFVVSIGIHVGVLMFGGFWNRPAEFGMQAAGSTTQVDLVAGEPEPEAAPAVMKSTPEVMQTPNPEEMVRPIPKKTKSPTPLKSTSIEAKTQNPSATGEGTPGQGATTGSGGHGPATSAKPDYLRNPPPEYPEDARIAHQEGVAILFVDVSENGMALNVSLHQSSGYRKLDEAALRAVKNWKFKPAMLGGLPVRSQVEVPVRFKLH
jgi:protein TonB